MGGLAGCSGSGGGAVLANASCGVAGSRVICLDSCNLGCSANGCALTDIAQNQIVIFQFSEDVDPSTVNASSIRFRTASGEQPVGVFFVNGRQVEFVPTLSISGGQTFFGFAAGETYTLAIPGGDDQPAVVRGTSGKPFARTHLCTLRATLGIVDLNGVAPRAKLVVPGPNHLQDAPRDTDIVLEFNEMIDATPFLTGSQSPVSFSVRRTRLGVGGGRECDPNSTLQTLAGTQQLDFDAGRGISILSFRPAQILPGNICVEISVTDGVADLSGRPAQPQTFSFLTEVVPLSDFEIVETFANEDFLDVDASAARWTGGTATFFQIGGDGRHGPFSLDFCTDTNTFVEGKRLYTLNTDNTVIPASNTTSGSAIAVTDGRFQFTTMVLPSDARLKFVGTKAPIVTVAGKLDILGHLDVSGTGNTALPTNATIPGQAGGAGGVFGGNGGKGGDKITATQAQTTGATAANQGVNGQDANMLAGHGYAASRFGTGGRGSTVFPASGLNSALFYGTTSTSIYYTPSAAAGGGGGGFLLAGAAGQVVSNNHPDPGFSATSTAAGTNTITVAGANWIVNRYSGRSITITSGAGSGQGNTIVSNTNDTITVMTAWTTNPAGGAFTVAAGPAPNLDIMGPPAAGGTALQLLPFPVGGGLSRASEHFLVGGSGGGGSASHACCAIGLTSVTDKWISGMGGGGGGGAMALRAGRQLRIGPAAKLLANGGSAPNSIGSTSQSVSAPAGGGSGGSIVLQSGNTTDITGNLIDVRGGSGGTFNRNTGSTLPPAGATVQIQGGNGQAGYVRLEAPTTPALSQLVSMQPAATLANVATLTERDDFVACRSKFYSTGLIFGPEFARYEIRGSVDGVPFLLSDDPAVSTIPAGPGAPVRARFQAAQLEIGTNNVLTLGPWRDAVRTSGAVTGIASDGLNGFRFMLIADYAFGNTITLDEIVVVYRN